jgi:ATP phosphoribosyltransferase-like protein
MINDRSTERSSADQAAGETEAPAQVEIERSGFSLGKSLRSPRTLISFGLAIAIIFFVLRGLNIDLARTWQYMRGANPWLMLLALLVFYLTFPVRAIRWRLLLDNAGVPVRDGRKSWASLPALMEYLYLSWFANCIVPAKLGDAYRGYLLKRNGKVSFSATFGTIFAERLLDMLGLFSFLVLSGWFVFGTHLPRETNFIFIAGLVLVLIYTLSQWRDVAGLFNRRQAKLGTIAVASIVIVMGILVAINYLASRQNWRWDLTASKEFSLSDQTKKVIQGLDSPVKVLVFTQFREMTTPLAAFLGSLVTVLAVDRMDAQVIVKTELPGRISTYHGVICVPEDSTFAKPADLDACRVATSFPRTTQRYLEKHRAKAHLVPLSGSVEVMIALGVADAIVDLVETGSTLAANRLRVLCDIGNYETMLIQNTQKRSPAMADRVVRRLEGVVIARSYSLLEYNVPRDKLSEAEKITPGYNSPTVNSLEDPAWCAVQVMVKRSEVIDVMEKLEALGASAILETQINNCRL